MGQLAWCCKPWGPEPHTLSACVVNPDPQVVESTGVVVTPYLDYPQLLGVLLRMLNESTVDWRKDLLKVRRARAAFETDLFRMQNRIFGPYSGAPGSHRQTQAWSARTPTWNTRCRCPLGWFRV
jgi:hypothetical protein